jgi:hypothetical protein
MSKTFAAALAVAVACAAFLPGIAGAAPKRARLTIDVRAEGTEGVVGAGTDRTTGKFREGYTFVTTVETDGDLVQFNTKDPEHTLKMLGMAQGVQAKVRVVQGKPPVKRMTPTQIQSHVQKKRVACGADQACLMNLGLEAQELIAASIPEGSEAASAQDSPDAYTGDEPPRYLNYFGFDRCGATGHYFVDRTTQGTLGDTSGAVPYTVIDKADHRANAVESGLICSATTLVVDSTDGSFWMDSLVGLDPKGTSTTTIRGKTTQASGEAAMHGEYQEWVMNELRHVPRAGTKSTTIKLTQGRGGAIHSGTYSGEARVTLTWKLEDLK